MGIDGEQFARDPYGSGIQRVLQYLAKEWPSGSTPAEFVFPDGDHFVCVEPSLAAGIFSIPFTNDRAHFDLRGEVVSAISVLPGTRVTASDLGGRYTTWLLPEVSYLPSVLNRVRAFNKTMTTVMIGYDALPMTHPENYRFKPGTSAAVSEYFLLLTHVDKVVCISEYARLQIVNVLRRSEELVTVVAHPGGDHVSTIEFVKPDLGAPRFLRLGTLEARKMPIEILRAFLDSDVDAELVFIGSPSASDASINAELHAAVDSDANVNWIQGASDLTVREELERADVFLSIGIEGYGIPVLEALAVGTPVVYSGVQPAGELMHGVGATPLNEIAPEKDLNKLHEALVAMFTHLSKRESVRELATLVDPSSIPNWRDFVEAVAVECHARHPRR